jgi:hypothetical protein
MAPSALTLNYDAVLSTTLFNWSKTIQDQISTANALLFYLMKKKQGGYQTLSYIGDRMAMPLMYALGQADSYSGYDVLQTDPMEGITTAFYDWRQSSVPIAISGLEEKKNQGEEQIVALLDAKTKQAMAGIKEFVGKRLLLGAGSSSITSAYTSSVNGSSFIDPLPLLVKYDPTTSTVVGNINQLSNSWWRNQTKNSTGSTFAAVLKELENLRNACGKGVGGSPDLHVADQSTYEFYCAALRSFHQNPSYADADIPFDNVAFHKKPVTWDEWVPDVQGGSETQSTTSGTWWMLNTDYWGMKVHSGTNFSTTPFQKPENQDAKVATILWLGAAGVSNRRKQGVAGGIDTTITS